ncbi:MAG TPA: hypothetical protein VNN10_00805 [Dehalococcoidia bacterium]|nr:hypothetical protein [Dehalococcoidia bacterium]
MGFLVTLFVSVAILLVVARLTWPRDARAPMPLYVATIVLAFFAGSVAGSLADGRSLERTLQTAALVSAAIALVAVVSWFRVKAPQTSPPGPRSAGGDGEERAGGQARSRSARRRRGR